MSEKNDFQAWAIIELFGHQRIAGRVTEQAIGGCSFLRVDVPEIPADDVAMSPPVAGYTKLYGNGAIYAITIVEEQIARAAAATMRARPVTPYTLRSMALSHRPAQDEFSYNMED